MIRHRWPNAECQNGHDTHRLMFNAPADMWVYDWRRYWDFAGYCTGQDDVSRTIDLYGLWDAPDTDMWFRTLSDSPGSVVDLGCHIGWFTLLAARAGRQVVAVDGNAEHLETLARNVDHQGVAGRVGAVHLWIDGDAPELHVDGEVAVLKMDLEAAEDHAIRMCRTMLAERRVRWVCMEVSPVFADHYPTTVATVLGYGYRATLDGAPFDVGDIATIEQGNVWFERV